MNVSKELKLRAFEPVLKKHLFKKNGSAWTFKLESGVEYIVELVIHTVVINNFSFSINYGIYYQGVQELLYSFPLNKKHGAGNCIFHGSVNKKQIKQFWVSDDFSSFEAFKDDVSNSLENSILPFLNNIKTGEDLLDLFKNDIDYYLKNDSILALKIACLHFLLGKKEKGKDIVETAIRNSKLKFDFAESLLFRMRNLG